VGTKRSQDPLGYDGGERDEFGQHNDPERYLKKGMVMSTSEDPYEAENLCFLGDKVAVGTCQAVVIDTGFETLVGSSMELPIDALVAKMR